jgi:hypothetical protein
MGSYQPLPNENATELAIHNFDEPVDATRPGGHTSPKRNVIDDASDTQWDSLSQFVETSFRSSVDLSTLVGARSVDGRSYKSNRKSIQSSEPGSEAPDSHRRMSSVNSLLSTEPSYESPENKIETVSTSKFSPPTAFGVKMWNPIWLTKAVLLSFCFLYIGIFFVVLALYLYSEAHGGLL